MTTALDPLVFDLVEWVEREPRSYVDVIEVWRTSCPRLTVWEDPVDLGYVERKVTERQGVLVVATESGREFLRLQRVAQT